ncbi:antibiotic biosynthesis monooxygenase [Afipia massiliensis]|uniref:Antibiotic biosynthesis monooxygenase n=1 Tax=Afipia massiliensis TaxID=211460 RepID=A0A4U6BQD2_9BRAD|nr:putative quinol monooxygenase [Afipia massiliensis]TKT72101.1 antibiotic biosynthesis monooxygenase [Afipia massiliensis]
MIVVTGKALAKPETFDEIRRLSLEHVHRSRTEPGCISHAVHIDCENPLRFVFVEQWADRQALTAHFQVPASREFVKTLRSMLSEPSTIQIYDVTELQMP